MKPTVLPSLAFFAFGSFMMLQQAHATINVANNVTSGEDGYESLIMDNDLINSPNAGNGEQTTLASETVPAPDNGSVAGVNDGTQGDGGYLSANDTYYSSPGTQPSLNASSPTAPIVLTFNLNLNPLAGGNALGYNISEISTIAGWGNNYDASQAYSVGIKLVGQSGFTLLDGGEIFETDTPDGSNAYSTQTLITSSTGILASGVAAIEFNLYQPLVSSNGTVYHEFDVVGTDAVPEPSTYALFLVGGLAVLGFRMRRRMA